MFRPKAALIGIVVIWAFIITIYYVRRKPLSILSRDHVEAGRPTVLTTTASEAHQEKSSKKKEEPQNSSIKTKEDEEIAKDEPEIQGEIKHGEKMCLDTLENREQKVGLWECHGEGRNQFWIITRDHMIKNNELCVQAPSEKEANRDAKLARCDEKIKEQKWSYKDNMLILQDTNNCLTAGNPKALTVVACDKKESVNQKFTVEIVRDLGV